MKLFYISKLLGYNTAGWIFTTVCTYLQFLHLYFWASYTENLTMTYNRKDRYIFFISTYVVVITKGREVTLRHGNKYIKSESKIQDLASYSPQ